MAFFAVVWKIWLLFLSLFGVVIFGIFIVIPAITLSKNNFPFAYKMMRIWAKLSFYGSGFVYKKIGNKNLEENEPVIVIANHSSIIDIFVMLITVRKPMIFIGKKEAEKYPLFGIVYKRLCVLVDRSSPESRKESLQLLREKINQGYSICVFPEGGVPEDTNVDLAPFKIGAFLMAKEYQLPIAVFTIWNTKKLFPFDFRRGRPGRVIVKLVDVISSEHKKNESVDELRSYSYEIMLRQIHVFKSGNNRVISSRKTE